MADKIKDKDVAGIIKKISIYEYFLKKYKDLFSLNENNSPLFWETVSCQYRTSIKYDYLALKESDSPKVKADKKELAITYLNYLETVSSFVFKTYYEVLNKLYERQHNDKVWNIFRANQNLYECFENIAPNFMFDDVIDSRNFELSNREQFLEILRGKIEVFKEEMQVTDMFPIKDVFYGFFTKEERLDIRLREFIKDYDEYLDMERTRALNELVNKYNNQQKIDDIINKNGDGIIKNFDFVPNNLIAGKPKSKKDTSQSTSSKEAKAKPKKTILPIIEAVEKNFQNVIGMEAEKESLIENAMYIKKSIAPTDLTYMLYGEPGVGKSMFVECASKSLYDAGFLKNANVCRISGSNLQGEYIGQTVPKVIELFKENRNGTIFLDEAYTLLQGGRSFVKEALGQLMIELENIRTNKWNDKTLFVMAGYEDKMKELLKINEGLESRIINIIKFKNYDNNQMFEFYKHFLKENQFYIKDSDEKLFKDLFLKYIDKCRKMPNFSNARLSRCVADQTMKKQARRADENDRMIALFDLEKALEFEQANRKEVNTGSMGFGQ